MNLDLTAVGERIREALIKKGTTATQVAEMLGVSKATVSQWFRGRNLTLKTLWMLSEKLDISLNWMVYGMGSVCRVSSLDITEKEEALLTITRHLENDVAPIVSSLFRSIARYNEGMTNIENKSRADQVFELARIGRVTFLLDGRIVDTNSHFRELTGFEEREPGQYEVNCQDVVHPRYRVQLKSMKEEVKALGRSAYLHFEIVHFGSGERTPVICKSSLTTWGNQLAFESLLKPVNYEFSRALRA